MKKFIYLFAFCFLLSAFSLNAQTTQYHFPEDEAGFEKGWVKHSSPIPGHGDYWEFETNWFYTLNSLYCVENSELTAGDYRLYNNMEEIPAMLPAMVTNMAAITKRSISGLPSLASSTFRKSNPCARISAGE